jgi:TPR repeat protein
MCGALLPRRTTSIVTQTEPVREARAPSATPEPVRAEPRRFSLLGLGNAVPDVSQEEMEADQLSRAEHPALVSQPPPPPRPAFETQSRTSAAPPAYDSGLHGPSFLGLSDSDVTATTEYSDEDDYRYEVQGERWRLRFFLVVLILGAIGGLGYLQWRRMQTEKPSPVPEEPVAAITQGTSEQQNAQKPSSEGIGANPSATTTGPAGKSSATPDNSTPAAQQTTPQQNAPPSSAARPPTSQAETPQTKSDSAQGSAQAPPPGAEKSAGDKSAAGAATPGNEAKAVKPEPKQPPRAKDAEAETAAGSEAPPDESEPSRRPELGVVELKMAKTTAARDASASAMWLWKATAKGNTEAPVLLADMYLQGRGVEKNCDQALVLLKSASHKSNPLARRRLGSLYAAGQCVPQDRVQAYKMYSSAIEADPSNSGIDHDREMLWVRMTGAERQRALAETR